MKLSGKMSGATRSDGDEPPPLSSILVLGDPPLWRRPDDARMSVVERPDDLRTAPCDLVILDSRLPGFDPAGVVHSLREPGTALPCPILLIVAPGGESACMEAVLAGADDFLQVPFSAGLLEDRIDRLLEVSLTGGAGDRAGELERSYRSTLQNVTRAVLRRKRLYDAILSTTPDLAYVFDLDHRFIYANEALLKMWGSTSEEAIGRNCLELGYSDWHAALHDREIDEVVATKLPIRGEVPFNGTGGRRVYDYIFTPVIGADGEVEAVAGTSRDVTERKEEEQKTAFLGELTRKLALVPAGSSLLKIATEAVGNVLGAGHCSFGECFEGSDLITILEDWSAGTQPSLVGSHRLSDFGGEAWWREFSRGFHAVENVETHPDTRDNTDAYRAHGILSYAVQTYRVEANRLLILSVTSDRPRCWTPEEIGFLDEVLVRVWPLLEKSRAEDASRMSRKRLALLSDHIPALISHLDADHIFRFANARYGEWFGVPASEIEGRHVRDVWGEEIYRQREPFLRRALAGETVIFEGRAQHDDLGWRDLQFSLVPEPSPDGTIHGLYKVAFDITERKRVEEALVRQGLRLKLLSEAAAILLVSMDPDLMLQRVFDTIGPHLGLDVYLNFMVDPSGKGLELRSSRGLTVAERDTFQTIRFGQAVCGAVALSRSMLVVSRVQQEQDPRAENLRGMGLNAYVCNPLLAGDHLLGTLSFGSRSRESFSEEDLEFIGTITRYVTSAYVRLKLVENLRDSDRRKDQFLATLAHELRNPLAPILTGLDVILASRDRPEQVERVAAMMRRQTGQMVHLIEDLLDISRITTGRIVLRKSKVDLAVVIRDAIEASQPFIEQFRHEVEVDLPREPLMAEADPKRMAQVVSNLLSNAAKYTPSEGGIRVEAGFDAEGDVFISVKDNGEGVDPAAQERIFGMFEQEDVRRQDGLGIGLTLVKTLMDLHDGSIELESAGKGHGSRFTVKLPALEKPAAAPAEGSAEAPSPAPASSRIRAMVVDDGRNAADVLALFLQMEGMETSVAYDGAEAVEKVAEFRPDIVFMDLGMPRMDGFEAARHMRAILPEVILVAFSGWGRDEDKLRAAEAGFDAHAVKPVDPVQVRGFLRLLESRDSSGASVAGPAATELDSAASVP